LHLHYNVFVYFSICVQSILQIEYEIEMLLITGSKIIFAAGSLRMGKVKC
jgi:hypothetical protein